MKITPSHRGSTISHAEELSEKAEKLRAKGKSVIAMSVGQPMTGAPKGALEKVQQTIIELHGYTSAVGIKPLRERIAQMYQDKYNVKISPERIFITNGGSGAFMLAFIGCFDAGQTIGIPLPSYYSYLNLLSVYGLYKEEFCPVDKVTFQPSVEDFKHMKNTIHGLLITSPSNPTGTRIPNEQFKNIINYCQRKNILVISDEIYHGVIYDKSEKEVSALNFSNDVVVINSFSKYFSMPGWRVGWMVVPDELIDPLRKLARNMYICPPGPSQYTALKAFDEIDALEKHIERYAINREILLNEMPKAGFDKFPPLDGAFYLYAHVKHLTMDSVDFCHKMLEEIGVIATPGSDFDPIKGHHNVRFSYAGSEEDIREGIKRLIAWRKKC